MNFSEISRQAKKLKSIKYISNKNLENQCDALLFLFEEGLNIFLSVDKDTDEFIYEENIDEKWDDLEIKFPEISMAYDLPLIWFWEMKNHQNYFDAVQFEFFDSKMEKSLIFQFKVAASTISIYKLFPILG